MLPFPELDLFSGLLRAGGAAADTFRGPEVPLVVFAGPLGAGKTTLVERLLEETDRPIAVLVNDFANLNIDATRLRSRTKEVLSLSNGCICCSLAGGFVQALQSIRGFARPFAAVVVEASGVSNPQALIHVALSTGGFRLRACVLVLDATNLYACDDKTSEPLEDWLPATEDGALYQGTSEKLGTPGSTAASGCPRAALGSVRAFFALAT